MLLLVCAAQRGVIEVAVFRDDVLDTSDEEGRPVGGFGGRVGREALVAPVGEESAGLEEGRIGRREEERRDEGRYLG